MLKNKTISALLLSVGFLAITGCAGKQTEEEMKESQMSSEMKAIHEELKVLKETKAKYMHGKRHFEREAMRLQTSEKSAARQYQQFILRLNFLADEVQKEIDKLEAEKVKLKKEMK